MASKKNKLALNKKIIALVTELGGKVIHKGKYRIELELNTIVGKLIIKLEVEPEKSKLYAIYTHFENHLLASHLVPDCGQSGKWNFYDSDATVLYKWFKRSLEKGLVVPNN